MEKYTVSRLARLAGISIRTLHHYDKIGLLKPAKRAESRYRYYGKEELYRLQQILFFKELNFSLSKIQQILDDPDFDQIEALEYQKKLIEKQSDRLDKLLTTIDKTIKELKEDKTMLSDEELYEGFSKEQIEAWNKEVDEQYDPKMVAESRDNVSKMTKPEMDAIKTEQENQAKELAELMDEYAIDSEEVQAIIKRHHQINEKFYKTSAEVYKGLGDMYVSDSRFAEFYDRYKPGLSKYLRDAMHHFAGQHLE